MLSLATCFPRLVSEEFLRIVHALPTAALDSVFSAVLNSPLLLCGPSGAPQWLPVLADRHCPSSCGEQLLEGEWFAQASAGAELWKALSSIHNSSPT
jgi:hypothetical protein